MSRMIVNSLVVACLCAASLSATAQERPAQGRPPQQENSREQEARQQEAREQAAREKAAREQQKTREKAAREQQKSREAAAREQQKTRMENAREQQKDQREAQRAQNARGNQAGAQDAQGSETLFRQFKDEAAKHRDRVARINALRRVANARQNQERVAELDQLLARENERHGEWVRRTRQALGASEFETQQARIDGRATRRPDARDADAERNARDAARGVERQNQPQ